MNKRSWQFISMVIVALLMVMPAASAANSKKPKDSAEKLRAEYIAKLQEHNVARPSDKTVGSLWSPSGNALEDMSGDSKAHKLYDTIVIVVAVQTTATQSGNSSYQRTFQTASGITGLPGKIDTSGLNPLFNANSSTQLAGKGATDSNTTFQTSLTGQVVAVLPSGNLVVEAQRKIFMNNQHEDVTVRGVVRPVDISPNNTVASAALSNLEIEMKGKGIISDSTRPLNPITRAILWLVGF
ncbi:MAG: flagellar basal body L-ring protein FlgH [Terracidiphilus sp.]